MVFRDMLPESYLRYTAVIQTVDANLAGETLPHLRA
jgi:hypothetical protein